MLHQWQFESLCQIDSLINRMAELLPKIITAKIAAKFKFCPVTSVDLERRFKFLKKLLFVNIFLAQFCQKLTGTVNNY